MDFHFYIENTYLTAKLSELYTKQYEKELKFGILIS